jgi:hypothetical protein
LIKVESPVLILHFISQATRITSCPSETSSYRNFDLEPELEEGIEA